MTWREKVLVRILLFVAWIIAIGIDRTLSDEVKHLSNHISVHVPEIKQTEPETSS